MCVCSSFQPLVAEIEPYLVLGASSLFLNFRVTFHYFEKASLYVVDREIKVNGKIYTNTVLCAIYAIFFI